MPTPTSTAKIPYGHTARRLEWPFLPPEVRGSIERHCGSPVVDADSQASGFTPGFASVLTCADGSRHFVKAASSKAQAPFAAAYRDEARKLALLPTELPAPRLLWWDDGDWVVLGLEYVDGRIPRRPWIEAELDRALDACELLARTQAPGGDWTTFGDDFADAPRLWQRLRRHRIDLDGRQVAEAHQLATGFAGVTAGDSLVHTDLRDDNVILGSDGRTVLCDWNWTCLGAAWIDTVILLGCARVDGVDVESVLARRTLTRDVPSEHVDALLALLAGCWLTSSMAPTPNSSPYVRGAQRRLGDAAWAWLADRRGWS